MTPRAGRLARVAILTLIVPIAGYVVYSVVRGRRATPPSASARPGASAPATSEMKQFTFQQTEEGKPLYSLRARHMVGTESGVVLLDGIELFEIQRPTGTVRVQADHGRVVNSEGKLSVVNLDGHVTAESESGERFEAPSARYLSETRTVTATGPVRFRSAQFSGEGSALEQGLDTGAVNLSGPVEIVCEGGALAGWSAQAAALNRESNDKPAVLSGGVRFTHPPSSGGAEPEWISADRVDVGPSVPPTGALFEGSVQGTLASAASTMVTFAAARMELSRPDPASFSRAVLRGAARLETGDKEGRQQLDAPEIEIAFDLQGRPTRVQARSEASLTQEKQGDRQSVMATEMSFDLSSGRMKAGMARGSVRIADAQGQAGGEEATIDDRSVKLWGGRPWARQDGRLVIADRLDSDRISGLLRASGSVHAQVEPSGGSSVPSTGARSPLFSPGKTVYLECPEATFVPTGRVASFRGGVRVWQDQTSLQADELDLHQDEGLAHAWGHVITRGIRQPSTSERIPYSVAAAEMFYESVTGELRYRGGAVYIEAGSTLRADEIQLKQTPPPVAQSAAAGVNSAAGPPRGRGIERLIAAGAATFAAGSRRGSADIVDYFLAERKIFLFGRLRPASLDDDAQARHFEGPALTVDLAADNIAVGTQAGERGRARFAEQGGIGARRKR